MRLHCAASEKCLSAIEDTQYTHGRTRQKRRAHIRKRCAVAQRGAATTGLVAAAAFVLFFFEFHLLGDYIIGADQSYLGVAKYRLRMYLLSFIAFCCSAATSGGLVYLLAVMIGS
jgi:hypothetical protein